MSKTLTMADRWKMVRAATENATGYAFDGCHKIYVLMDARQYAEMAGYPHLVLSTGDPDADTALLRMWYDQSCGLRFINAVHSVSGDPNDGFHDLIPQFADEWDDDDDD